MATLRNCKRTSCWKRLEAEAVCEEEEEEIVQEDKFTLDNIESALQMTKTFMGMFYDIDPSMMRALKVRQAVEEALIPSTTVFKEMKRQNSRVEISLHFPKLAPKSSASPILATPEAPRPTPSPPTLHAVDFEDDPDNPLPDFN